MINFIATRPVTPIRMCCLRFFVVKKIYHPNSDSKYVLGKVDLYFFLVEGRGGEGEGRDENIRALLAGRFFFFRLSCATYNFFILPTYQIERICLCT